MVIKPPISSISQSRLWISQALNRSPPVPTSFPFCTRSGKPPNASRSPRLNGARVSAAFLESAVARGATTKRNADDKRRSETRCQNDGTAKGNDMIGPLYAVQGMFVVLRFPPLESTPLLSLSLFLVVFYLPPPLSFWRLLLLRADIVTFTPRFYDSLNDSAAFLRARLNFVNGTLIP